MQTLRDNPEVVWGFLLALGVVLVLTPGVGRFARIFGVVDQPGETRRVHTVPVPRLGGIALLLGIFVPALAFLTLEGAYRGILLGAAIATTVGAIDDFRGLPWWGKLAGQVAAGSVAVGFGVTVDRFTFPGFGSQELPEWAAGAATIVWVVAIMNMVNFLDGMDGLAAGVCAIAGSTFAVIGLSLGAPDAALLSAIVAGACFGFLHHNFYPARIFMGVAARVPARHGLDSRPRENGGVGDARPAAARSRHSDHRHVVRLREATEVPSAAL
jgi:UDP-GlcNAc:undecaprenyl-phosphate/decaprenyl-phosphate GlcNAc-1-phosphate transferase